MASQKYDQPSVAGNRRQVLEAEITESLGAEPGKHSRYQAGRKRRERTIPLRDAECTGRARAKNKMAQVREDLRH